MNPLDKLKSALLLPVIPIPLMISGAVPEFVRVKVCVAENEFTSWSPKLTAEGFGVIPGTVPFPLSATFSGLFVALCAMASDALRLPGLAGVNTKLTVAF